MPWVRDARAAGLALVATVTDPEIDSAVKRLADEKVSVAVVDTQLSFYMADVEFSAQLQLMDRIAKACRSQGLRAVAYYPTLEVLTVDATSKASSMYKDHPSWVQVGIDGKPNYFIGGDKVFWVEKGWESAWMCPSSGYVEYFSQRVARLAGTGLDGLLGDVPLLSAIVGKWPCTNDSCRAAFKTDTGLDLPTSADFANATFRRWVAWRHTLVWRFLQRVSEAARTARSNFEVLFENVTVDHGYATLQGLDGGAADHGPLHTFWEIGGVSLSDGMRGATADDWMSFVAMTKFARGASGGRSSWAITYGAEEADGERVMAVVIAAGLCPHESKTPLLVGSAGTNLRRKMYGWLNDQPAVTRAEGANPAAVLFSAASRDVLDGGKGHGMYASIREGSTTWWSNYPPDALANFNYLGEYRGCCKALVHAHVPFDVITEPHATRARACRYKMIVAPSLAAVSDAAATVLEDYVRAGGVLVLTGPELGRFDDRGQERSTPRLQQLVGLAGDDPRWLSKTLGKGTVVRTASRPGLAFLRDAAPGVLEEVRKAALGMGPAVTFEGPPAVVMDVRFDTQENVLLLLCVSLVGLGEGSPFAPERAQLDVAVPLNGRTVAAITVSSPGVGEKEMVGTVTGGRVHFKLEVDALSLVSVHLNY